MAERTGAGQPAPGICPLGQADPIAWADARRRFSSTHDLTEAETMLAERVKQWTEEWKREGLKQGIEEGLEKGIEQGLAKGMEKGKQETQRAIARALLDIIPDDVLLAERTGVPVAEINAMRQETPRHN
jgi:flagellar biosynthesis/type III secretory pathway protein FliH